MTNFIRRWPLTVALTLVTLGLQFAHVSPASAEEYSARTYCDPSISTPYLSGGRLTGEFGILCGARRGYRVNTARSIAVFQSGRLGSTWATWSDRATGGEDNCTQRRRCYSGGTVGGGCNSSDRWQMRVRVKEIVKGSSIYGVEFRDVRFFYGHASAALGCGRHQ